MDLKSVALAIEFFRQRQLHGVVSLLEFLLTTEGDTIRKIGSTTIGFQQLNRSKYTTEEERMMAVWNLGTVHFGRLDGKRTPVQDIAGMATPRFDELPEEVKRRFDMLCSDLHLLTQGGRDFKLIGSGMMFGQNGQILLQ
ncbi:MAG: hypothetical protein RL538_522 [Candidatus Parcubacteria bacterium]